MPGTSRSYTQVPPELISLIQPAKQSIPSSCLLTQRKPGANQKPGSDCFQGMTSIRLSTICKQKVRVQGRLTLSQLKGPACAIPDLHNQVINIMPKNSSNIKNSNKTRKVSCKFRLKKKKHGNGSAWDNRCYHMKSFSHLIKYILLKWFNCCLQILYLH